MTKSKLLLIFLLFGSSLQAQTLVSDTTRRNWPKVPGTYNRAVYPGGASYIITHEGLVIPEVWTVNGKRGQVVLDVSDITNLNTELGTLNQSINTNKVNTDVALSARTTIAQRNQVRSWPAGSLPSSFLVTDAGREGTFIYDQQDVLSADNGATVLVNTATGYRYKRVLAGELNATWFGANGDDTIDDGPAFQAALNEAFSSKRKVVRVPKGNYVIQSTVTIPIGCTLEGLPEKPTYKTTSNTDIDSPTIVVKTAQNVNTPCFVLLYNGAIKNFTFFWPEQSKTATTPIPYGWAITTNGQASNGDGILIENIMLTNAYRGINVDFGGQWDINNIKGQCFDVGIQLDRVFDVSRLSNVHFWNFWAQESDPIFGHIINNATILKIGRVDGVQANNIFGWQHKHLLHFFNSSHTNPAESGRAWCMFNNVQSDLCKTPILIDGANFIQLNNVNGTTYNIRDGSAFIETGAAVYGNVSVSNMVTFHANAIASIRSTDGTFKFSNVSRQERGDGNDVFNYKIINQSTAKVLVDEADYKEVSGSVQIGGQVSWQSNVSMASQFPNFSTPTAWDAVSTRTTAITNGARFNLNFAGLDVTRIAIPPAIVDQGGLYVVECDIKLNNPENLNTGQFYLRVSDGAFNDVVFPAYAINFYYPTTTHLKVPLIVRGAYNLEFVFGNNGGACSVDITNLQLYKMNGPNRQTIDWVHSKAPNALNKPLPASVANPLVYYNRFVANWTVNTWNALIPTDLLQDDAVYLVKIKVAKSGLEELTESVLLPINATSASASQPTSLLLKNRASFVGTTAYQMNLRHSRGTSTLGVEAQFTDAGMQNATVTVSVSRVL